MFKKIRLTRSINRVIEDRFYEMVAEEMANEKINIGTWTRAKANSDGDKNKTESLYIKYRVQTLHDAANAISIVEDEKRKSSKNLEKKSRKIEIITPHQPHIALDKPLTSPYLKPGFTDKNSKICQEFLNLYTDKKNRSYLESSSHVAYSILIKGEPLKISYIETQINLIKEKSRKLEEPGDKSKLEKKEPRKKSKPQKQEANLGYLLIFCFIVVFLGLLSGNG